MRSAGSGRDRGAAGVDGARTAAPGIILTTARLAVEGRDRTRQAVPLADIIDVVVVAAGAGEGAGYAVRVQHWRAEPALVAELDDEGEARRLAQAIVAAARAAP